MPRVDKQWSGFLFAGTVPFYIQRCTHTEPLDVDRVQMHQHDTFELFVNITGDASCCCFFPAEEHKEEILTPCESLLQFAATLLQEGASVSDAVLSVGVADLSYFIQLFKQHYGVTPRRYKQHNK